MTKATRTREYILERTAPIFNRQGYAGTSMSDLTEATGLTKGALYGNFRDKQGIASAAFRYSMERVRQATAVNIGQASNNKETMIRLLNFFGEFVLHPPVPGGCPMMNTAVEADDHQSFLRKDVATEITRTVRYMATLLKQGMRRGEFDPKTPAMEIAFSFFSSIEGAIVISRITSSRAPMKAVLNQCKNILEQISI